MRLAGSRRVFTVEEVTAAIAVRFEDLRSFWVEAEIQDLRPSRGQVRFSLRGEHVIEASMNRVVYDRLPHKPEPGTLVQAYGRVQFWRPRSQLSMRVELLEPSGEGLLRARIEELRRRLDAEGLLAAERKRPLPMLPRRVGLVTSGDGAARDDFLGNAWARFPEADVLLVDVPVQGEPAPALIARAIAHLDRRGDVDVIVVARGGGSLEDLMAFNSEPVCRAIAAAATPVVSAVGHERDVTLCDLVADARASAPSAAAALVLPSREALDVRLADARAAARRGLLRARAEAEGALARRATAMARELARAERDARQDAESLRRRLVPALRRAAARAPAEAAARAGALERAARERAAAAAARVDRAGALLGLLSPARTVARGYAIVRDAASDAVVASAAATRPGQELAIELRDGRVAARVGGAG